MNPETKERPSKETIEAAYLAFLGRKPESEEIYSFFATKSVVYLLHVLSGSTEYTNKLATNNLYQYNSSLKCEEIIRSFARSDLKSEPDVLINFLGVKILPKFLPQILDNMAGCLDSLPIPGNWHADTAEWAAALRAVTLAKHKFRMLELGCGWGCWMLNTGAAAKSLGLEILVSGVEADEGHITFAHEACALNGFSPNEFRLMHGIAAAQAGTALFPRQDQAGENWGNEPILDATPERCAELLATGRFHTLPLVPLGEAIGAFGTLDLLHIDIQGSEADLIDASIQILSERVAYLVIGTHSREIEGRLFNTLDRKNWILEVERPAILRVFGEEYATFIDGVQGWRNRNVVIA